MRLAHLRVLHVKRAVGNTGAMCVSGSQPRQIQVGLICGERMALRKVFFSFQVVGFLLSVAFNDSPYSVS